MIQTDSTQIDSLIQQKPVLGDMRSIYEPPAVGFTFETVGWAILGALMMLGVLIALFFLVKKHIDNRYRREALITLQEIQSDQQAFPQIFVVLKRVAIQAFGRERVGNLHGKSWLSFLDKTGKNVGLQKYEQEISAVIYQGRIPDRQVQKEILSQAQKWIRTHAS